MASRTEFDSTDLDPTGGEDPYRFGVDFVCVECDKRFSERHYDGRWDHPPGEPRCPECEEAWLEEA